MPATGQVLERPTGELAALWHKFAFIQERKAVEANRRREERKAARLALPEHETDPISP